MSYMIKELPVEQRPRERFKEYGVEALSNEELLSILLRTGTKSQSVKDVSTELLKQINIHDLANINYKVLKSIKGIGEVKAITLLSAIELGKRVLSKKDLIKQIRTGEDVYDLVKDEMKNELQEKLIAIYLDTKKYVIMKKVIFIGTVNQSDIHLRDVFREAVKNNASYLILVHNHPTGNPKPSMADLYLTASFISMGKKLEIPLIDHIIIGNNIYYSFRESNGDLFEQD